MADDGGAAQAAGSGGGSSSRMFQRYEQTFPVLTAPEIARMRRFGEIRTFKDGECLFETGKPGHGMFVVLSGNVILTQRDGLGRVTPVIEQGSFSPRAVSCRGASRWSMAMRKAMSRRF